MSSFIIPVIILFVAFFHNSCTLFGYRSYVSVFPFMSFCQLHISTFISCFFVHSIFLDRSMYLCPFHVPLSVLTSRIAWYNSQIHVFLLSFVFDPRSSLIPSTFSYLSPKSAQRRYWHLSYIPLFEGRLSQLQTTLFIPLMIYQSMNVLFLSYSTHIWYF